MDASRTYQARITVEDRDIEALFECADLFAHVEHSLFADIAKGKNPNTLKSLYLIRHGISARHFNAIRVKIEGKIASIKELRKRHILEVKERIKNTEKKITRIKNPLVIHQKKRRLHSLKKRLEKLEQDRLPLCFGSKKLFHAQFNLEANGYKSQEEWKAAWQHARANEIFLLGSKDETSGNQSCTATLEEDGTLSLRIRFPDALAGTYGKYLHIKGVHFAYGQKEIIASLTDSHQRQLFAKAKDPRYKNHGKALTYRLKHDKKGWRIFITTELPTPQWISNKNHGVIGVDINVDHLALVDIDRFGNPVLKKTIPLNLYGKTKEQSLALIGDASAEIISYAEKTSKPVILENLDFQKKKGQLKESSPSLARTLSSFAYQAILTHIKSRGWNKKIQVHQVNPAYTSLIGKVKFASRYGLSLHHAAALCIGRRFLNLSEKVPRHLDKIPDGKDGHIALSLPVRNRNKHVWSLWRQINKKTQAALAARFRTKRSSSTVKTAPETENLPDSDGETPTRESLASLFG